VVGPSIDVSVLIVGYNSAQFLDHCMASIPAAVAEHSHEVLFINNGTDESEKLVKAEHPHVRILPSLGNIGFAAGNDYLADEARGRWLLLLNPDTRLYAGALDALLEFAKQNPHYEVLGGVTVDEHGALNSRAQLELLSLRKVFRELVSSDDRPNASEVIAEAAEVEALSGGFMMVSRACWTRLQGLDPDFFLYAEELDFFKRLKDEGGRAAQVASSRVFHDIGSGDVYSPTRIKFLVTGNAHYLHKHFTPPYAYACISLMWLTMVKRYVGGALLKRKGKHYARMSRGFAQVAKAPWTWMWGYNSPGADPRRTDRQWKEITSGTSEASV